MATRVVDTRSRRYDPAETRQRVLEAANMLFSTKGYVNTGTADIARQADVSEGSIFYHFGSKRNLLAELGRMYGQRMIAAMHREGEDIADLEPGITVSRCFDFCTVHREWDQVVGGGTDFKNSEHGHCPEAEPFYEAAREVVVAWVEAHIRAVLARRGQTDINAPVAAALTHAAVGRALDLAFRPGVGDAERQAIMDETIRFIRAACDYQHGTVPSRSAA